MHHEAQSDASTQSVRTIQPVVTRGCLCPISPRAENEPKRFVSIEKTQPKVEKATLDVDA
jgi:hypothetical protein